MSTAQLAGRPIQGRPSGNPRISLVVKGHPVSVNRAYGNVRTYGRKRLTEEAAIWRDFVRSAVMTWREDHGYPVAGPLELRTPLTVKCIFVGVRGDADNYLKLTLDGLKMGLAIDDREFAHVEAEMFRRSRNSVMQGCLIDIWEHTEPADDHPDHAFDDEPLQQVTVFSALAYDSVVIAVPAVPRLATRQYGLFITIEHARDLYAALGNMLQDLDRPGGLTTDKTWVKDGAA